MPACCLAGNKKNTSRITKPMTMTSGSAAQSSRVVVSGWGAPPRYFNAYRCPATGALVRVHDPKLLQSWGCAGFTKQLPLSVFAIGAIHCCWQIQMHDESYVSIAHALNQTQDYESITHTSRAAQKIGRRRRRLQSVLPTSWTPVPSARMSCRGYGH